MTSERDDEKATLSLIERLLWIVLACVAWRFAGMGAKQTAFGAVSVILGFGIGLIALVAAASRRASKWLNGYALFGFFTYLFVEFAIGDAIYRDKTIYKFTTDAHVYMDYAARLVLQGKNPYEVSLYGAIIAHRVPIELQTPLMDGGLTDRVAYPSFSFLYLVPFVKAGIDTRYGYALALYAAIAVVYWNVPKRLRVLVVLPFFVDQTYVLFFFGGVTDSVWALLLCLVVVWWKKRPALAAICFGLACAYKQHPWLLFPYLALRLAQDIGEERGLSLRDPGVRKEALVAIARFAGFAAAAFIVVNLPFALWSWKAWFAGVTEPLITTMVPMGEGVSSLLPFAGLPIPKLVFSLAFWGSLLLLLVVCGRWEGGKTLIWVAPSLAFFLNFRSLSTYWYFNVFPFALAVARDAPRDLALPVKHPLRWRTIAIVSGAFFAVLLVLGIVRGTKAASELVVDVHSPLRTWDNFVHRIDVRVTNKSSHKVNPRFWVQGINFQPLPWRVDEGPAVLEPGATAEYSLSAMHRISEFEYTFPGRLTVADATSELRTLLLMPSDQSSLSIETVPNGRYRYWDVHIGSPTKWSLSQRSSPGAHVRPLLKGEHHGVVLHLDTDPMAAEADAFELCIALPSCWALRGSTHYWPSDLEPAEEHRAALSVELAARTEPVALWARTPKGWNTAPFADRYGVQLSFDDTPILVLLGGERASGTLDDGTPYEVIEGPRDVWHRYEIDVEALRKRYAAAAYPRPKTSLVRFPLMDLPTLQLRLALSVTTRMPKVAVEFGEIEDPLEKRGRDPIPEVMSQLDQHPGQVDLWRATYELEVGNRERAFDFAERAMKKDAHPDVLLGVADIARQLERLDLAEEGYRRAIPDRPIDGRLGLGWVLVRKQKLSEAHPHFKEALSMVEKDLASPRHRGEGRYELLRLNATVGLALCEAAAGNCTEANRLVKLLPEAEQQAKRDLIPELAKCAKESAAP